MGEGYCGFQEVSVNIREFKTPAQIITRLHVDWLTYHFINEKSTALLAFFLALTRASICTSMTCVSHGLRKIHNGWQVWLYNIISIIWLLFAQYYYLHIYTYSNPVYASTVAYCIESICILARSIDHIITPVYFN